MSPRTLDSLMHNEAEANPGHLGESQTYLNLHLINSHIIILVLMACMWISPTDSLTLDMDVASPL